MPCKVHSSNSMRPTNTRKLRQPVFFWNRERSNAVPVELTHQVARVEPAGVPSDLRATDDATLVAASKKGEAAAFATLVERHERRIFFVALRMTRNREDAEDVAQQSFQKAFVHLNSFVGKSSFSTWLTRIAINEALMVLRKIRGWREVLIDDVNENAETAASMEVPAATPDPEASYSRQERQRMLSSAMKELTPGMRKTIELRELDELSTRETARAMSLSVSAVKARVFHGRKKLREAIERQKPTLEIRGETNGNSRHRLACPSVWIELCERGLSC